MKYLDTLGGPDSYNHYPTGWAVAFSTPFQMFKRYSQYSGGTCDPLVIHWPAGMKAKGQVRHQYHHATDIAATILHVAGLDMPKTYRGVEQHPMNGVSMRYSFDDADAPTTKTRQYYSMLGTRGIWENGWKAAALHAPISGVGHFDQDKWELYHVDEDRSESKDLAAEHPDKLKALVDAWFEEADKNFVLPLDDRTPTELLTTERPQSEPPRNRYVDYPGTAPHPRRRRRECSRSVLQDHRRRRHHRRCRRGAFRARLTLRWPRPVYQGSQTALRLQLPRHDPNRTSRPRN